MNGKFVFCLLAQLVLAPIDLVTSTDQSNYEATLVKDILPGIDASEPADFLPLRQNLVFFTARDAVTGREPYISDGTPEGTLLLKDIATGEFGSAPRPWLVHGGKVYFTADGDAGSGLWVSDGTAANTYLVYTRSSANLIYAVVAYQDEVYFGDGKTLWKNNGSSEKSGGTVVVKDFEIEMSEAGDRILRLATLGEDKLLISAGMQGLWAYTAPSSSSEYSSSIVLLANITARFSHIPKKNPSLGGNLYFVDGPGDRIWSTDGTAFGTTPVTPSLIPDGAVFGITSLLPTYNGRIHFVVDRHYLFSTNGVDLLPFNFTLGQGSSLKTGLYDGFFYGFRKVFGFEDILRVARALPNGNGYALIDSLNLWVTENKGGTTTTKLIKSFGGEGFVYEELDWMDRRMLFKTWEPGHPDQLWITDYTQDGTYVLTSLGPDGIPGDRSSMAILGNDEILLAMSSNDTGAELFKITINESTPSPSLNLKPSQPLSTGSPTTLPPTESSDAMPSFLRNDVLLSSLFVTALVWP